MDYDSDAHDNTRQHSSGTLACYFRREVRKELRAPESVSVYRNLGFRDILCGLMGILKGRQWVAKDEPSWTLLEG